MSDENELSPAERELETALRSLRPTTARLDAAAAARAAGNRTIPVRRRYWQMATAAAAVVAAVGTWLAWGRSELSDRAERTTAGIEAAVAVGDDWSAPPLTFASYRQALTRSPAELDALLDRQASESARDQLYSAGMPTVWNANFRSSIGEM